MRRVGLWLTAEAAGFFVAPGAPGPFPAAFPDRGSVRERLTPRGLWRRSGVRFPLVPVLCFSPSPFSSSFSLLLSSFLSFSSPRFPLVPVLCFWFGFCVCVFGGGGLWCGVLCGGGLRLAWVWFVVFDVGVVWMGGSVLGPVWVRVCLAVCAFVRVSLLCCFGGEF